MHISSACSQLDRLDLLYYWKRPDVGCGGIHCFGSLLTKKRTSFPIQKHQYSVLYFQISCIFMTPSNVHFEEYWMMNVVYAIEAQLLPCNVFFFMGFSLHWNLAKTLSILCIFIN